MKTILTLVVIAILSPPSALSQVGYKINRFSIGYGFPNILKSIAYKTDKSIGPFQISYKKFISDNISIGIVCNYSYVETKSVDSYEIISFSPKYLTREYSYHYNIHLITCFIVNDYTWKNTDNYNMYSGLAIGCGFAPGFAIRTSGNLKPPEYSDTSFGALFHATLFGFNHKIGNSGFGAYSELGLGFNGIVQAGINYSY